VARAIEEIPRSGLREAVEAVVAELLGFEIVSEEDGPASRRIPRHTSLGNPEQGKLSKIYGAKSPSALLQPARRVQLRRALGERLGAFARPASPSSSAAAEVFPRTIDV